MDNTEVIEIFEKYLRNDKKASDNTLNSYLRDIRQLSAYLEAETIVCWKQMKPILTVISALFEQKENLFPQYQGRLLLSNVCIRTL